jgi:hypothetical protein
MCSLFASPPRRVLTTKLPKCQLLWPSLSRNLTETDKRDDRVQLFLGEGGSM